MGRKVKRSVTLDADLLEFVGAENLSRRLNALLREEVERLRHHQALRAFLDHLEAEEGPLLTPHDRERADFWDRLLGPAAHGAAAGEEPDARVSA